MPVSEFCALNPKQVFVREATGLVRSFSWIDALIIGLAVTGPTYFGIASQIGFVAPADPGADFTLSALYGLLFMIPLGLVYYLLSTAMPRSGGDYVWMGRTLNPVLGFVGGWAMWISFLALLAAGGAVWGEVVVPVVLATLGYIWNIPYFVTLGSTMSMTSMFVAGIVLLLVGVLFTSFGPRAYSWMMKVLGVIMILGTIFVIGILATTSNATFVNAFNNYGGVNETYAGVIQQAASTGWSYAPVNSAATLLSIPFGILLFNGFNYSVYVSGEMKDVKKSMLWGTIICLLICGALDIAGLYFAMNMIGYQFNQAAYALFAAGKWPWAVAPWLALFLPSVVSNPYLSTFIQIGWLAFYFWWAAGLFLASSRYVFAFSFDRILPVAFADINEKLHFPLKATMLNLILAILILYITVFTTYVGQVLNTTTIWAIVWAIVAISAIVYPFRKHLQSTGLIGGKWAYVISGALTFVAMSLTVYYAFTTPAVGPSTLLSDEFLLAILLSGIGIYAGRYYMLKKRGIDLGLALKEIPPE